MTENLASDFWAKWYQADELGRLKLTGTLTGLRSDVDEHSLLSLVNSYLVDLAEYLEDYFQGTGKENG